MKSLKTKKCIRCKDLFFPNRPDSKKCPWCVGKPVIKGRPIGIKYCRVVGCGKEREPNISAKGLCAEHYNFLVKIPNDLKRRRLKSAEKWKKEGMITCKFFEECEVYFIPKARNQFGLQKYCFTCNKRQHSKH